MVAYASRRLSQAEVNYCVTRRELLAIVHFVKYFRHYLLGRTFVVRTDHVALRWLKRIPQPIGQQARWLEILEEFSFTIVHRAGAKHGNADAMSRRPCDRRRCCPLGTGREQDNDSGRDGEVYAVGTQQVGDDAPTDELPTDELPSWTDCEIKGEQETDPDLGPVYAALVLGRTCPEWDEIAGMSGTSKALFQQWTRLHIVDGVMYRQFVSTDGSPDYDQILVPRGRRRDVFELIHGGSMGGHFGRKRTEAAVRARAYWPGWTSDVRLFLRQCAPCAMYHRGKPPRSVPLKPFQAGEVWETVSVDITGPHPRSVRGHLYIVTLVDHFSKWAEAFPVRNHTAQTVARILFDNVFSRMGMPRRILTDQGAEFESTLFAQLCSLMDIAKVRTTPYRPSTNAVVERFHKTLNSVLAKIIDEDQRNWCLMVPHVLAAYRSTRHESTGFSPNRIMYGRELCMPADLVMGCRAPPECSVTSHDDFVSLFEDRLFKSYDLVRNNLSRNACERKKRYDVGIKTCDLEVGVWVYYFYLRRRNGLSIKWQSLYTGPFLIVRVVDSHRFVIQKSSRSKTMVVHRDKLKRCHGHVPASWLPEVHSSTGDAGMPAAPVSTELHDAAWSRRTRPRCRKAPESIADNSNANRPSRIVRRPVRDNDYRCTRVTIGGECFVQNEEPGLKSAMAQRAVSSRVECPACQETFGRPQELRRHLHNNRRYMLHERFFSNPDETLRLHQRFNISWRAIEKEMTSNVSALQREVAITDHAAVARTFHGPDGRRRLECAVHETLTSPAVKSLNGIMNAMQRAGLGLRRVRGGGRRHRRCSCRAVSVMYGGREVRRVVQSRTSVRERPAPAPVADRIR